MELYQRGFTSVDDFRAVDVHELVAEAGIAPELAIKIKSYAGDVEEPVDG